MAYCRLSNFIYEHCLDFIKTACIFNFNNFVIDVDAAFPFSSLGDEEGAEALKQWSTMAPCFEYYKEVNKAVAQIRESRNSATFAKQRQQNNEQYAILSEKGGPFFLILMRDEFLQIFFFYWVMKAEESG